MIEVRSMNTRAQALKLNLVVLNILLFFFIVLFFFKGFFIPTFFMSLILASLNYIYFSKKTNAKFKVYFLSFTYPAILGISILTKTYSPTVILPIFFLALVCSALFLNRHILVLYHSISMFVLLSIYIINSQYILIQEINNFLFLRFLMFINAVFTIIFFLVKWVNGIMDTYEENLEEVEKSEEKYRLIAMNIQDGLIILGNNRIEEVNNIFLEMIGVSSEEILGEKFETYIDKDHYDKISRHFLDLIFDEVDSIAFETDLVHQTTQQKIRIIFSAAKVDYFGSIKILATIKDITAQKKVEIFLKDNKKKLESLVHERTSELEAANKKLNKLLQMDGLTGLQNHKSIVSELSEKIHDAKENDTHLSMILLDLDRFKNVNDTFGHLVGDEVLRVSAQILQDNTRDEDLVGRYGGEEFIIVLPKTSIEGAIIVAEKIRRAFESYQFEKLDLNVTISGGISVCTNEDTVHSIIDRADKKLYQAKHDGRNQIKN